MAKNKYRTQLISVKDDEVWGLISKLKDDKKNVSEFICNAIKFYQKHKDKYDNGLTEERVRVIIKEEFEKLLEGIEFKKDDETLNIDKLINNNDFDQVFSSFENTNDEE